MKSARLDTIAMTMGTGLAKSELVTVVVYGPIQLTSSELQVFRRSPNFCATAKSTVELILQPGRDIFSVRARPPESFIVAVAETFSIETPCWS